SGRAVTGAARGNTGGMPCGNGFVVLGCKAQGTAIGAASGLAVQRLADDESAGRTGIDELASFWRDHVGVAEHAHRRVVELAAALDVVRSEKHVGKHGRSSPLFRLLR